MDKSSPRSWFDDIAEKVERRARKALEEFYSPSADRTATAWKNAVIDVLHERLSSISAHKACVEALMQLRGNINDGALTPDQTMIAVLIDRKLAARVNAALAALEALEKANG